MILTTRHVQTMQTCIPDVKTWGRMYYDRITLYPDSSCPRIFKRCLTPASMSYANKMVKMVVNSFPFDTVFRTADLLPYPQCNANDVNKSKPIGRAQSSACSLKSRSSWLILVSGNGKENSPKGQLHKKWNMRLTYFVFTTHATITRLLTSIRRRTINSQLFSKVTERHISDSGRSWVGFTSTNLSRL